MTIKHLNKEIKKKYKGFDYIIKYNPVTQQYYSSVVIPTTIKETDKSLSGLISKMHDTINLMSSI
jgi:hypothetical protein